MNLIYLVRFLSGENQINFGKSKVASICNQVGYEHTLWILCCYICRLFFMLLNKLDMEPEKPTILGENKFRPSARCPNCNLIMYLGNRCPHCYYLLNHSEQNAQHQFWKRTQREGYIKGAIFFSLFFTFVLLIFGL